MMTDNEFLLAISDIMDKKLKPVNERIDEMQGEMQGMRGEMQGMRDEMQEMRGEMQEMRGEMQKLDERQKKVELTLENNVIPRLQNIEDCYTSTYTRYKDEARDIEAMKADIDIMKSVLIEHSEILKKIS